MAIVSSWAELPAETASAAVSKRNLVGQGATLVRVTIAEGTRAERHSHPFEQFVQVITGGGTLETDEGVQPFAAGDVFHFLPGIAHAATFTNDTVLIETNLADDRR